MAGLRLTRRGRRVLAWLIVGGTCLYLLAVTSLVTWLLGPGSLTP